MFFFVTKILLFIRMDVEALLHKHKDDKYLLIRYWLLLSLLIFVDYDDEDDEEDEDQKSQQKKTKISIYLLM